MKIMIHDSRKALKLKGRVVLTPTMNHPTRHHGRWMVYRQETFFCCIHVSWLAMVGSLIYLYNILGWSSFRGRSAVTTLGDKTSFGPPFVFCVLELSRKSPYLWACFHSLSPLSVVSAKKGNFNTSQYEMLKLIIPSSVVIRCHPSRWRPPLLAFPYDRGEVAKTTAAWAFWKIWML
jgi:hypothetical protein